MLTLNGTIGSVKRGTCCQDVRHQIGDFAGHQWWQLAIGRYGILQHHQFGALHLGQQVVFFTQPMVPSMVSINFAK